MKTFTKLTALWAILLCGLGYADVLESPLKDSALYFLTITVEYSEEMDDNVPLARLGYITREKDSSRQFCYQRHDEKLLLGIGMYTICHENNSKYLVLDGTVVEDGNLMNCICIINTEAPYAIHMYKHDNVTTRNAFIEERTKLLPAFLWHEIGSDYSRLFTVDAYTMNLMEIPKERWRQITGNDSVMVNKGKLCYGSRYLSDVCLDDISLPIGAKKGEWFVQTYNRGDYLFLWSCKEKNKLVGFLLTKSLREWRSVEIKGSAHWTFRLLGAIAFRIGWRTPARSPFDRAYTGEWILLNLSTLAQNSFMLEKDSEVFFMQDGWLFARSGASLLSIPVTPEGVVKTDEAVELLSDDSVLNVKAVFLGPKPKDDDSESVKIIEHSVPVSDEPKEKTQKGEDDQ